MTGRSPNNNAVFPNLPRNSASLDIQNGMKADSSRKSIVVTCTNLLSSNSLKYPYHSSEPVPAHREDGDAVRPTLAVSRQRTTLLEQACEMMR